MSEDKDTAPASAPESTEAAAPRVRRISNPRPKKSAQKAAAKSDVESVVVPAPVTPKEEKAAHAVEESSAPEAQQDWPEAETISEGGGKSGNDKRKRRRRKGKGGQNSQQPAPSAEEVVSLAEATSSSGDEEGVPSATVPVPAAVQAPRPPQQNQQHQHNRPQVSAEVLAKRAWKIFLAEVSEEGVSLISDQDARELSKRCFRLAEIFLDEQGRRLR